VVTPRSYTPDRGDFVWLQFSPQAGHEQAGHRPAFVVSPRSYNEKVGLALMCPVTSQAKGYPFEVRVTTSQKIKGAVLSDQVKSLDWRVRQAQFVEKAKAEVTAEVIAKIESLLA
jgi:mRNA interferase MazF